MESHGCLDLPAGDGVLLVVVGQMRRLGGNPLEDVVDKRVHDGHAGDARIRVVQREQGAAWCMQCFSTQVPHVQHSPDTHVQTHTSHN